MTECRSGVRLIEESWNTNTVIICVYDKYILPMSQCAVNCSEWDFLNFGMLPCANQPYRTVSCNKKLHHKTTNNKVILYSVLEKNHIDW